jgi:predicted acyl esterase
MAGLVSALMSCATASADATSVQIRSWDGTVLDGWVHMPENAEGRVPVLLMSSPYFGQSHTTGGPQPAGDDLVAQEQFGFGPMRALRDAGFALALFNVRGTGGSEGCFDFHGRREERDQVALVRWAAEQDWSTGKVGMFGLSYMSVTALEAAVRAPKALEAVAVAGVRTDPFTFWQTPQGAWIPLAGAHEAVFPPGVSYVPSHVGPPERTLAAVPILPQRLCPDVARQPAGHARQALPISRNSAYFRERRRIDRLRKVRAAVLLAHGLQDKGLAYQEDLVWSALPAALPKWQLAGQWGHSFPTTADWPDRLVEWFDHFLRGGPAPERLGKVDYLAGNGGGWRESTSWPPTAQAEALFLSDQGLTASAAGTSTTVRAVPTFLGSGGEGVGTGPNQPVCPDGLRQLYLSAPLEQDAVIAGNSYLRLVLTGDHPAGMLEAMLFDLGPDFGCDGPLHHGSVRALTEGAADLRFHAGNLSPEPFPVGVPQIVRIDLDNLAERVPAGHRLGVLLAHPPNRYGGPHPATLRVAADEGAASSQIVLPLVDGTLGGSAPEVAPPPRPFAP